MTTTPLQGVPWTSTQVDSATAAVAAANVAAEAAASGASDAVAIQAEEDRAEGAEGGLRHRFIDQGAAKAGSYAMASWHSVKFDCTAAPLSQPLPSSPIAGDEVYVFNVTALGGNNLTVTGTGGPFTLVPQQGDVILWTGLAWEAHEGRKALAMLDNRYEVISVANSSGDVAAIQAAIATQTVAGKPTGRWASQQGKIARISQPTTLDLGYSNTQNANWATDTTLERVKLSLDILPDAGLGAALTIKGGYGVELDINVLGGGARGTVTDVAMTGRTTSADGTFTAGDLSAILTSASANFTQSDVGAPIAIPGAGSSGATLYTTIKSVTDSTHAVLNSSASTSVTTAACYIGTFTVSSPAAIAAGLKVGAVVFITGAGPSPEGQTQPLAASVRSVDTNSNTFTVSEGCWSSVSGASMNWFDVAVRLEDCVGLRAKIYDKGFQGYLLAADATNDVTRRLRSCLIDRVMGNGSAGSIFWKSIEAFGSLGHIWSNTIYGDYFGLLADTHWTHWEGGISQPTNQLARTYLWFDRCNTLNNPSISVGDRATECAVLMTGDSQSSGSTMGRFSQIRCTMYQAVATGNIANGSNQITNVTNNSLTLKVGQTIAGPGIPDGTTITGLSANGPGSIGNGYTSGSPGTVTISNNATAPGTAKTIYGLTTDGVKMVGVSGVTIGVLDTAKCIAGLRVVGGGATGINVLFHKSLSSDLSPLVVQAGAFSAAPRVRVESDYRFVLGYLADIGSGLGSGTDIRWSGYAEGAHQAYGATGRYAARCASSVATLDIANLRQKAISGISGFIDAATVTLRGKRNARLANDVPASGQTWVTDGSDGYGLQAMPSAGALAAGTGQVAVSNTVAATMVAGAYTIPANSVVAGTTYRLKAWGTVDNDAGATVTLRLRLGGTAGVSIANALAITNASAKTNQGWNVEYIVQFRGAASSTTPTSVGGQSYSSTSGSTVPQGGAATNVNMTVDRDLELDATWSAATATNIIRCEGFTIEKVK
jgi:hypothetical protein